MQNLLTIFSFYLYKQNFSRSIVVDCYTGCLKNMYTKPCSHRYDIVPFHFGSFPKSGTERGCVHTSTEKSSGPFQSRSRNWAIRKSEPEIGMIRYRTVPFSCEQKQYDTVPFCSRVNRKTGPLFGPVWFLRVTPSWFL